MLVNQIINVDEDFESGDITEPVTLTQAKNYLRLEGFTSDDSGEQEFDFDDTLIESMITEARMWVEKYTGLYLVPRTLTVVLLNQAGYIELPGPVLGTITWANDATPVMVGRKVETKYDCKLTATYEAGYTSDWPKWVENSILAYVAWAYENRGDEQAGSPERAAAIARPHRRVKAWG